MTRTEKLYRVYAVLFDGSPDGPPGPAGDGTFIKRFRDHDAADRFAAENTCYGRPASVQADDVPRRLAQRWGCA